MNPPPKIIDLTSDFFEKDTEGVVRERNPTKKKERVIINNARQNAIMIEVGKKKI